MDTNLRAEALAGPFEAVIADRYGNVVQPDQLPAGGEPYEELEVSIRRRTALPSAPDADGERRLHLNHCEDDVVAAWSGLDYREAETCWIQAEAMTAGLNAASGKATQDYSDEDET